MSNELKQRIEAQVKRLSALLAAAPYTNSFPAEFYAAHARDFVEYSKGMEIEVELLRAQVSDLQNQTAFLGKENHRLTMELVLSMHELDSEPTTMKDR